MPPLFCVTFPMEHKRQPHGIDLKYIVHTIVNLVLVREMKQSGMKNNLARI